MGAHRAELLAGLHALANGTPHENVIGGTGATAGPDADSDAGTWAFGGSAERAAQATTALRERFPAFAAAHDEVSERFGGALGGDAATFALHVALARLLLAAELRPGAVVGRGVGEVSAAHLAGALDLPDACRLVAQRDAPGSDALALTGGKPTVPVLDAGSAPFAEAGAFLDFGPEPFPDAPRSAERLVPGDGRAVGRGLVEALARLHTSGATVGWAALFGGGPRPRAVPLPTYAFQRRRFWLQEPPPADGAPVAAYASEGGPR
ncbi:hypothetical protein ACFQHO_52350 [Actinomadura yumaensis]|uniref:hypothetical protein n=1 Tax=Actinomadura yumaensis TaxID=111807 RepID=UPI003618FE70